ncbi:MAG: ABC transporter ATP-binding protein [Clostridia bacterium]|nr:ABC transporter ATP-binding protein [Clostridia bacterium]
MMNAIEVCNLTKQYPKFYLDHVNLTLPCGCIMGFVGENGAGKSTTIKAILDMIHTDEGSINLLGATTEKERVQVKDDIGVVFDSSGYPDNLNALQVGKIQKCIYTLWDDEVYTQYLEKFVIDPKKKIKDYSRGMKMKLSIATALSHHAKLLILDEATSGLDPVFRDQVLDVFYDFIQEENHSILISSHIVSDLERICDYVTFIHKGKIIVSEEKDELLEKYRLVKVSREQLDELEEGAVIGKRVGEYGCDALVNIHRIPENFHTERATLEEIMVYMMKEE